MSGTELRCDAGVPPRARVYSRRLRAKPAPTPSDDVRAMDKGTGDLQVESDFQIGKSHASVAKGNDGDEPWVNPGTINKASSEHASQTNGMGFSG